MVAEQTEWPNHQHRRRKGIEKKKRAKYGIVVFVSVFFLSRVGILPIDYLPQFVSNISN